MITSPVLIYQDERELEMLAAVLDNVDIHRTLEIGSAYGGTLYRWLQRSKPGDLIVSLDIGDERMVNHPLWRSWVPEGVRLELVVANSQTSEAYFAVTGHSLEYDFIFIDGDHKYEAVKTDWMMYRGLCRKGGVIVFDDIKPNNNAVQPTEVDRLWAEIKQQAEYAVIELIADHHSHGNGLGVVYV